MPETLLSPSNILLYGRVVQDLKVVQPQHSPFVPGAKRGGANRELADQLAEEDATFARIYGFSYEGTYYDLPRPMLFLVHGAGFSVTQNSPKNTVAENGKPATPIPGAAPQQARAPGEPSISGMAATDVQFSDEIMVWSYDKSDQTIRMDTEAGEFEEVLLAMFFGGGVSGAKVSGAKVSGAKVSGAKISGAKLSGGRGDASD